MSMTDAQMKVQESLADEAYEAYVFGDPNARTGVCVEAANGWESSGDGHWKRAVFVLPNEAKGMYSTKVEFEVKFARFTAQVVEVSATDAKGNQVGHAAGKVPVGADCDGEGPPEAHLQKLFDAADRHGVDTGESDHSVGNLQDALRQAWKLMTPSQRTQLIESEPVQATLDQNGFDTSAGRGSKPVPVNAPRATAPGSRSAPRLRSARARIGLTSSDGSRVSS